MTEEQTELSKRNILRFSNEESNRVTRECIEIAFINLLSEKNVDKITISEIAKKAGVSRSALYRNYESKEAILDAITSQLTEFTNEWMKKVIVEDQTYDLYVEIFVKIREEHRLFSLILKSGILDRNYTNIKDFIWNKYSNNNSKVRHILLGGAGLILHIIQNWYMEGMNESNTEMAELCYNLSKKIFEEIREIDASVLKN
ncbi:TetR/AcrR family transcriptional regulator [Macrococcoides canis]|uniref:TetR/AcrR family transcriptional regulator n=1 Tax=Macrococcoides canis TaxID=1855823 RepID=UPI0022B932F4|nr:TetR/AcrR family transcriptional regulator [Macrococcus canis]WBF53479.1 TetR/AcrR family transcriptional regulator [Macrococcus canis]